MGLAHRREDGLRDALVQFLPPDAEAFIPRPADCPVLDNIPAILLVRADDMLNEPVLQEMKDLEREGCTSIEPCLVLAYLLQKGLVFIPMKRRSRIADGAHNAFLGGKMNTGIVDQPVQYFTALFSPLMHMNRVVQVIQHFYKGLMLLIELCDANTHYFGRPVDKSA